MRGASGREREMKELKKEKVAIIYKQGQEKEMFKVREELC